MRMIILFLFILFLSGCDDSTAPDDDASGTITDIDGNVYQTVKIGDQWWMTVNLKVTHYSNGDAITNVTDGWRWSSFFDGAYCSYDNRDSTIAPYGLLYNWYAVNDSRNIAPKGWHVPTDEEWKELEMHLGMSKSEADTTGLRGTDEGGKLKSKTGWRNWGDGTNECGFSALPGGYRNGSPGGDFEYMGLSTSFWSSTEYNEDLVLHREINYYYSGIYRIYSSKKSGYSVRCVKNE